jgi:hypothetical protein
MAWFPHRPPVWWQGVEEFAADAWDFSYTIIQYLERNGFL